MIKDLRECCRPVPSRQVRGVWLLSCSSPAAASAGNRAAESSTRRLLISSSQFRKKNKFQNSRQFYKISLVNWILKNYGANNRRARVPRWFRESNRSRSGWRDILFLKKHFNLSIDFSVIHWIIKMNLPPLRLASKQLLAVKLPPARFKFQRPKCVQPINRHYSYWIN